MSNNLAVNGGPKIREKAFPAWPHFFEDEIAEVEAVLRERTGELLDGCSGQAIPG